MKKKSNKNKDLDFLKAGISNNANLLSDDELVSFMVATVRLNIVILAMRMQYLAKNASQIIAPLFTIDSAHT